MKKTKAHKGASFLAVLFVPQHSAKPLGFTDGVEAIASAVHREVKLK